MSGEHSLPAAGAEGEDAIADLAASTRILAIRCSSRSLWLYVREYGLLEFLLLNGDLVLYDMLLMLKNECVREISQTVSDSERERDGGMREMSKNELCYTLLIVSAMSSLLLRRTHPDLDSYLYSCSYVGVD